jgi:hypothetical protein
MFNDLGENIVRLRSITANYSGHYGWVLSTLVNGRLTEADSSLVGYRRGCLVSGCFSDRNVIHHVWKFPDRVIGAVDRPSRGGRMMVWVGQSTAPYELLLSDP